MIRSPRGPPSTRPAASSARARQSTATAPGRAPPRHEGDALGDLVPPPVQGRGRDPPGICGIDAPQPLDRPGIVAVGERQPDGPLGRGARHRPEPEPLLHPREHSGRGGRVAARKPFESVHAHRLHPQRLAFELDRAHPLRTPVNLPPRAGQPAVGRVEEPFQVTGEPDVAASHRQLDALPRQLRGEPARFEPHREYRVAGLRARLPRHPQRLRLRERAVLVPGREQRPGVTATKPGRGAAGIPLDELLPLALAGEPVQPAAAQPIRHRRAFVTPQERLDLPRRDAVEGLAQPRVLDVGKQRIVAEALPQPFPRILFLRRRTFRFDERGTGRGVRRRRTCRAGGGPRRAGCPGDGECERDRPPAGAAQRRRAWRHATAGRPFGRRPNAGSGPGRRRRTHRHRTPYHGVPGRSSSRRLNAGPPGPARRRRTHRHRTPRHGVPGRSSSRWLNAGPPGPARRRGAHRCRIPHHGAASRSFSRRQSNAGPGSVLRRGATSLCPTIRFAVIADQRCMRARHTPPRRSYWRAS